MRTKPIQPIIYISLAVLLGCAFSFGMKAYARTYNPCNRVIRSSNVRNKLCKDYLFGYGIYTNVNHKAKVSAHGYGYGYGYGVTAKDATNTTDTTTIPTPTNSEATTPETTTPETTPVEQPTNTDIGTVVVPPPPETTDTTTICQITKPRHLRAQRQSNKRKIVLRWTSQVSNCVSGLMVHYNLRIQTKRGKTILVARQLEAAKYLLQEKRLKPKIKYTFSVRAVASNGTKTPWSKAKRF